MGAPRDTCRGACHHSLDMTEGLQDPLRHNTWATKELLTFCGDLPPDQLQGAARLRHVVRARPRPEHGRQPVAGLDGQQHVVQAGEARHHPLPG